MVEEESLALRWRKKKDDHEPIVEPVKKGKSGAEIETDVKQRKEGWCKEDTVEGAEG